MVIILEWIVLSEGSHHRRIGNWALFDPDVAFSRRHHQVGWNELQRRQFHLPSHLLRQEIRPAIPSGRCCSSSLYQVIIRRAFRSFTQIMRCFFFRILGSKWIVEKCRYFGTKRYWHSSSVTKATWAASRKRPCCSCSPRRNITLWHPTSEEKSSIRPVEMKRCSRSKLWINKTTTTKKMK